MTLTRTHGENHYETSELALWPGDTLVTLLILQNDTPPLQTQENNDSIVTSPERCASLLIHAENARWNRDSCSHSRDM